MVGIQNNTKKVKAFGMALSIVENMMGSVVVLLACLEAPNSIRAKKHKEPSILILQAALALEGFFNTCVPVIRFGIQDSPSQPTCLDLPSPASSSQEA